MKKNIKFVQIILILIILNLFLSVFCESQFNRPRRDGLWWGDITVPNKNMYIFGYFGGMFLGRDLVLEKFPVESKCGKEARKAFDSFGKRMGYLNYDLIRYSMDSIYSDSTNLGLKSFHSCFIVTCQLLNADPDFIKNIIEMYREEDCKKFKNFDELKNYKLPN